MGDFPVATTRMGVTGVLPSSLAASPIDCWKNTASTRRSGLASGWRVSRCTRQAVSCIDGGDRHVAPATTTTATAIADCATITAAVDKSAAAASTTQVSNTSALDATPPTVSTRQSLLLSALTGENVLSKLRTAWSSGAHLAPTRLT